MGGADGILVGYDGSPGSEQALDWAIWEARAGRAALIVCHVWPPVPGGDPVAAELAGRTGSTYLKKGCSGPGRPPRRWNYGRCWRPGRPRTCCVSTAVTPP